jgi:hypothetical protein
MIDKLRENINYAPYCCDCNTMGRMTKTKTGFICDPNKVDHFHRVGCGLSFEFDKETLEELKTLNWDNAVPEREVTPEEMDKILHNMGIKR